MAPGPVVDPHHVKVAVALHKGAITFPRVLLLAILEIERRPGMPVAAVVANFFLFLRLLRVAWHAGRPILLSCSQGTYSVVLGFLLRHEQPVLYPGRSIWDYGSMLVCELMLTKLA